MNDDRISRYLSDQAEGITLSPADPNEAVRRGIRRRSRRRVGLVGGVAIAGVLATTLATRDPGRDQQVDLAAPTAVASTYDWSTVVPQSGLGYGGRLTQLADGSVYAISTAPGPARDGGGEYVPTLYRSTDGVEWAPASLPAYRAADLAGAGDTLYSVGTSPSGGFFVSASTDGARSWEATEIDVDLSALKARHPGQMMLDQAQIAALDADHIVVTVVATANLDLSTLLPEYAESQEPYGWEWDDTGVVIRKLGLACGTTSTTMAPDGDGDPDPDRAACQAELEARGVGSAVGDEVVASFTYEELGITGELRDHVGGKLYAFATEDGATFEPVELPAESTRGPAGGWLSAAVVAAPDGFRMFTGGSSGSGQSGTTTVLSSADGSTWTEAARLGGSPGEAGLLGDRAAVSLWDAVGNGTVQVEQPDGSWSALDLASVVEAPDGAWTYTEGVAFGPLGLAAVLTSWDQEHSRLLGQVLVHSDGRTLQVLDVSDHVRSGGMVSGVVVTADAIAARIIDPDDGKVGTPPSQQVLVGTPRG